MKSNQEANQSKKKSNKKGSVSTVLHKPCLTISPKITTKLKADGEQFIPCYKDGSNAATLKTKDGVTLPHRSTAILDCGVSVETPAGWKICINALSVWAAKGLIVTNPGVISGDRIKVYVTNVGKEIIVIKPEEEVAQISLEPLYFFDWVAN